MDVPKFSVALKLLFTNPVFTHVVIAAAGANFMNAGVTQFLASFFVRTHQLSFQGGTLVFGVAQGGMATLGILAERIAVSQRS